MGDKRWTRRSFLKHSGTAAAGALALATGACSDPKQTPADEDMRQGMGDMQDMAPDLTQDMPQDMQDMAPEHALLTKPPYVQLLGLGAARLRFETPDAQALSVRLEQVSGAMSQEYQPTLNTQEIDYIWPPEGTVFRRRTELPDDAGTYSVQNVTFDGLKAGERYRWVVHLGGGVTTQGEFVAAKSRESDMKLGWISDTMTFGIEGAIAQLLAQEADLTLHGGDFQYMSSPVDTWNGMFNTFAPVMAKAPFHICIGNHEYEDQDEFNVHYKRLFDQQGAAGTLDYHVFDYGLGRFIMLNSEIELAQEQSAQYQWLVQQLTQANADDMVPIVAFHRPYFTFSKSKPNFQTRDVLHPLFVKHKVPMVFTGHNHCYERFEVDDMVYVMDGGGGALSYNPDDNKSEVLESRPSDEPLRKSAVKKYGCSSLEIRADRSLRFKRHNEDGTLEDDITI